jgi:hypothetical protein
MGVEGGSGGVGGGLDGGAVVHGRGAGVRWAGGVAGGRGTMGVATSGTRQYEVGRGWIPLEIRRT